MTNTPHIEPGTEVPFELSPRERDAIIRRAFLDPAMEQRLRKAAHVGPKLAIKLTLDDVDELHGCVATEANHAGDRAAQRLFAGVCARLALLLDRYSDDGPAKSLSPARGDARFTPKQGQYLAFIYYFTKIHRQPPAEADLRAYFKVSAPTVHDMILTLERRGHIERVPGNGRSIRVRVDHADLPQLE